MSYVSETCFPSGLLDKPESERFKHFYDLTIRHELLIRAERELLDAVNSAEEDQLIFCYGPTGVGKSTMADLVVNEIIEARLEALKSDLGWIPAVRVDLLAPAGGTFSWAEAFREALRCMKEPLIDYKIAPRDFISGVDIPAYDRANARRYQHAYEKAMSHRRPIVILLDEAHYLDRVAPWRLKNQLDVVKCLTVRTKIPHAMLGTYDVLPLRNLCGEISRRSVNVHFPRYKNTDEELDWFSDALYTFQSNLPVKKCEDLEPYLGYLFEGSVGCIGNLKKWLNKALRAVLANGGGNGSLRRTTKIEKHVYVLASKRRNLRRSTTS